MTEDEAKKKFCPMSLQPIVGENGYVELSPTECLGSACMAWRWDNHVDEKGVRYSTPSATDGHCGMAGKP